jgi:iron complex outermembrane receptor protein
MRNLFLISAMVIALAPMGRAAAQPAESRSETVVISASALPGTMVDPDKISVGSQTLSSGDLNLFGGANALGALNNSTSGVSFADAQANPFQPNLFYRGFEASPLAGAPQGIAVYANGVRLNQPFGDTVNWDLIPDIAISRVTLEGSSPVFGLNALGGSVSLQLKNGFTYQGAEAEAMGGSFGRWQGAFQYGVSDGNQSLYVAGNGLKETGWRDHSPSQLEQVFADLGWRKGETELHLDFTGANNDLSGNGTAPVELLSVKRNAIFTYPDRTKNTYGLVNLFGTSQLSEALSVQGNVYLSRLQHRTLNGDASDADICGANLCLYGATLTDTHGDPIPDFLAGGSYALLNSTRTSTTGYGGALQASYSDAFMGRGNKFVAGVAFDGGHTGFSADSQIGALGLDRGFEGPGVPIQQPDGSIAPVRVASTNAYYGLYAADIFDVTEALSLNVSGRYNLAKIDLSDRLGSALNGSHQFGHFNPSVGATYKLAPELSFYAGYAQANRAPTPAEFSCADAAAPCSLTNFFVGDPALKQVVANTVEAGWRAGPISTPQASLKWHFGAFRTETNDDIMFTASPVIGRAFFQNIGTTLRQGLESSVDLAIGPWSVSVDYSYTDATFRSPLTLNSPENPLADATGEIHVRSGDHLPSVPANLFKATIVYEPTDGWTIALAARAATGVYLQGDESNLNPTTGGYAAFDVGSSYRVNAQFELFATVANLLDANYATFGTFSPVGAVPIAEAPGASNPRSLSPSSPRAFFGGVRVRM